MIIDCISDLHGYYPELEGGDLLIVGGDLVASDKTTDYLHFMTWIENTSALYKKIIVIAGNHDNLVEKHGSQILSNYCEYLCDSGTEFEGLKIWGSPWTATFEGMNPHCMAFTMPFGCDTEDHLNDQWKLIPDDVNILITHSPPYGTMDWIYHGDGRFEHVGSIALMNRIDELEKLKLHVYGHIHERYGKVQVENYPIMVNASHVNEYYAPINKAVRVII